MAACAGRAAAAGGALQVASAPDSGTLRAADSSRIRLASHRNPLADFPGRLSPAGSNQGGAGGNELGEVLYVKVTWVT